MNIFYDYDTSDTDYPEYSKTFHFSEVKKHKHFPERHNYVIKECTIELGTYLYTFTYAHSSNYKKNI